MSLAALRLTAAFIAGLALGAVHFGGLWWTVRRAQTRTRARWLFLWSFVVRSAITVLGLYLAAGGRWEALLMGLVGFLLARTIVTRRYAPGREA